MRSYNDSFRRCISFFIILIVAFGICIGMPIFSKWIFIDEPSHIKTTTCLIDKCHVTNATCQYYYKCHNYYDRCVTTPFTCYAFQITFTLELPNQTYNRTMKSIFDFDGITNHYDYSGNYPTICESNITECDYDDRNIGPTLSIYQLNAVSFGYKILWLLSELLSIGYIVLLIIWFYNLKCRNGYESIKSDPTMVTA